MERIRVRLPRALSLWQLPPHCVTGGATLACDDAFPSRVPNDGCGGIGPAHDYDYCSSWHCWHSTAVSASSFYSSFDGSGTIFSPEIFEHVNKNLKTVL